MTQTKSDIAACVNAVKNSRPRTRKRWKRFRNQSSGRNGTRVASANSSGQLGTPMISPVQSNFAWRAASKMPQYAPTPPSTGIFHGWSKASITK